MADNRRTMTYNTPITPYAISNGQTDNLNEFDT